MSKSIKKIAIFGSYDKSSVGDTAILLGLMSSLDRIYEGGVLFKIILTEDLDLDGELVNVGEHIKFEKYNARKLINCKPRSVEKFVNRFWGLCCRLRGEPKLNRRLVSHVLDSADVLVVGGGNLVMDMYPSWPALMKGVCELAIHNGTPYYFLGVGAGPIELEKSKIELLYCLKNAKEVAFRDVESKIFCEKKIDFNKSKVGPNLAFGIAFDEKSTNKNQIVVNLAAVYHDDWPVKNSVRYKLYIEKYCQLISELVNQEKIKKIVLFNTNYPGDEVAIFDFINAMKSEKLDVQIEYVPGIRKVGDLFRICMGSKLAVVTRLHAGIISCLSNVAVFAISYQPKVCDVLGPIIGNANTIKMEEFLNGKSLEYLGNNKINFGGISKRISAAEVDLFLKNTISIS